MKVFLSFSGRKGLRVAEALKRWLPHVINAVEPFLSEHMSKGSRWAERLAEELEKARFGIVCLTPDSVRAPWVLFEAGALSKFRTDNVCTFLVEVDYAGIEPPLTQFQHTRGADREDVKKLVQTLINAVRASGERLPPDESAEALFDEVWWPKLKLALDEATREPSAATPPRRGDRAILEEILNTVRMLQREPQSSAPSTFVADEFSALSYALAILNAPAEMPAIDAKRREALRRMEEVRLQRPQDRSVGIVIGRLFRALEQLPQAIGTLTSVLEFRRQQNFALSRDDAALHYNRACYYNLLAEQTSDPVQQESFRQAAWNDLQESIGLWPANLAEAREDRDLRSLPAGPRRFDALGPAGSAFEEIFTNAPPGV